ALVQSGNLNGANAAFGQLAAEAAKSGISVEKLRSLLPGYSALIGNGTLKNQLFTQSVQLQNQALSDNSRQFADSQSEIISFQQGIAAATGLLDTNGRAFWGNSAAALANRQQIINLAGIVRTYADNLNTGNGITDANLKKLKAQRDELIVVAEKFGLSHDAAKTYVDKLLDLNKIKTIKTGITVDATGKFKMAGGQNVNSLIANTPGLQFLPKNAAGGLIGGNGGGRADDKVTRISSGEFVVNAPATSKYLPLLARINDEGNRGSGYQGRGYAGGGLVRPEGAPAVSLPGLAGGGLLGKGSYTTSYAKSGDPADVIGATTREAAREVAGMVAFSVGRTALLSQLIMLASAASGGSGDGGKAASFALAQLGKPYVWGATGPNSFDCSGLTMRAWQSAGRDIGRTTYQQINAGRGGSRAQALPGDLHLPEPGHVMMFVHPRSGGGTEMVHAPHTGDHVRYAPFRGGGAVRLIATPGGGSAGGSSQGAQAAQSFAAAHLGEFGWGSGQMQPLLSLWNRESNWRWNATNPSSGAYGIPQSLPASKMGSAGPDWRTNAYTQVRWGLGYIQDRYGSPQQAMRHETNVGWYDDGGWLQPGLNLAMNATGKPEPILTGQQWEALTSGGSGGSSTPPVEYHAHFDGASSAALQSTVRTAFHVMGVESSMRERVGRRS
ncbi:NlpC/P60 family protein, partial [Actinacidiphila oryziradicis]|uniref:aggregation-promoting factor C-terminal-like domain-containing protein n=1 Tax=Actinacidiphila oryziradicis TaxID=2571141 RepID=UPI0023F46A2D